MQTASAWDSPTWGVNTCLQGNGGSFVDPALVNELSFHTLVRLPAVCMGAVSAPVDSPDGKTTTWSGCAGKVVLERVNGADHCVVAGPLPCRDNLIAGGTCSNSLEATSGVRVRDVLTGFFASTEK